jgi:nucleotide-binding universal stress UspA family protein
MILHAADDVSADLIVLSLGCANPTDRLRNDGTVLCLARYSSVPVYAASAGGEEPTRCVVALPAGRAHAPTLRAAIRSLSPAGRMWIALPDRSSINASDGIESGSGRDTIIRACGPEFKREIDAIEIDWVNVDGDMLSGVLRMADDVDAHLIATPNHGSPGAIRAFLPNLGEPLLHGARCSVLIVPDGPILSHTRL